LKLTKSESARLLLLLLLLVVLLENCFRNLKQQQEKQKSYENRDVRLQISTAFNQN